MQLRYGDYFHPLNEAAVTIRRQAVRNQDDRKTGIKEIWNVDGVLHGDTQSELTQAIQRLKEVYAVDGRDAILLFDDGSESAHVLRNSATTSGVRVVSGPNFPEGDKGEYSTFRSYTIQLEAEFVVQDPSGIISYVETLSFEGGGPRYVFLQTQRGKPQKQLVAEATPYRVRQSGSATGVKGYPPEERPLWPLDKDTQQGGVSYKSPRKVSAFGGYTEYETTWDYVFEAVNPFVGNPHFPP